MEDDDEFGDLYTDVLTTFPSSAAPAVAPPPHSSDLNPQISNEGIVCGVPDSGLASPRGDFNQTLVDGPPRPDSGGEPGRISGDAGVSEDREEVGVRDLAGVAERCELGTPEGTLPRIVDSGDEKVDMDCKNGVGIDEPCVDVVKDGGVNTVGVSRKKSENLDTKEEDTGIGDAGLEPVIPGLSVQGAAGGLDNGSDANFWPRGDVDAGGDDWDSDSEDDLQIVLNDNTHDSMAMAAGVLGSGDEDEDGEPLVIVGNDDLNHQQMEEQEWGEDAAQSADGDKKDVGEAGKVNGGMGAAPKIGYSSHGYHPFHSQFKYVRPGAAVLPGAATGGPGGSQGQVRPLGNMGSIAGRGRGDWRPTGIKASPSLPKNFHSGYGMPWSNGMTGRGFGGGLEFTLPSHKTIFEVDIDGFEEKPWKLPGVDISDYFNFGLNEEGWKDYCKQLEQIRLEATMQSRIRVYESGRTEKEYDPDLPPELAAAAGIHDSTAENANPIKLDAGQGDLARGLSHMRPPIPTGRAIQVESGYGERLPSIDTRPPRIRDSDSIIEIVLQRTVDDDDSAGYDVLEQSVNDPQREDFNAVQGEIAHLDTEDGNELTPAHNSRKRELVERRDPLINYSHDKVLETDGGEPTQCHLGSRSQISVCHNGDFSTFSGERQMKEKAHDGSSLVSPDRSSGEKEILDNHRDEGSVESIGGKRGPLLSSPVIIGVSDRQSDDQKVNKQDERVLADENPQMDSDSMTIDAVGAINMVKDEDLLYPVKKQKLGSRVEQPVLKETDDAEELKGTARSESSKEKSGNSKDYQRRYESTEGEVVQDRHNTQSGETKKHLDEDKSRSRRSDRNANQDTQRHRTVVKGRGESYSNSTSHSQKKAESLDRRKEKDVSDVAWKKRDEDPRGGRTRVEDANKRERGDEIGSRQRGKIRESDRSDKDEHLHSRKQVDNGSWGGYRDMELGSRHKEREDNLKIRHDNVGDVHSKRKKDEDYPRRVHADKEVMHGNRESSNRGKRERDEITDQRKRDDRRITRDNTGEVHLIRQRDRGERQRERDRDERHRVKQPHEDNLSRPEREGRGAVRSVRGGEEKVWAIHARAKDDYSGSDKDYPISDAGRHAEQHKRRDRIEAEPMQRVGEDAYSRGSQFSSEDRRSRRQRSSSRNDRVDNQWMQEKKRLDDTRKRNKEFENGNRSTSLHTKRNQEDLAGRVTASSKSTRKQEVLQSSKKPREDPPSDDERRESRRGRSKLERWASHKETEYSANANSTSPLKVSENEANNDGPKAVEQVDKQGPPVEEREAGDQEINDADTKSTEDRHLDTFAKLKKRSERFNLPMPSEKDPTAIKKMENEALPSAQVEAPTDSMIKQERPPRKRKWIGK